MADMGQDTRIPERLSPQLEGHFHEMAKEGYVVTSQHTSSYNCIAYAADDLTRKWDCTSFPLPGYYWPENAKRGDYVDAFESAFQSLGYECCQDGSVEVGFDKIALYIDGNGNWTHAAKQRPDGRWTSKLGDCEDIIHKTPHSFRGSSYGEVARFMRRPNGVVLNANEPACSQPISRENAGPSKPGYEPPANDI